MSRFHYTQFVRREGIRWSWSVVVAEGAREDAHADGVAWTERAAEKQASRFIRAHHEAHRDARLR